MRRPGPRRPLQAAAGEAAAAGTTRGPAQASQPETAQSQGERLGRFLSWAVFPEADPPAEPTENLGVALAE